MIMISVIAMSWISTSCIYAYGCVPKLIHKQPMIIWVYPGVYPNEKASKKQPNRYHSSFRSFSQRGFVREPYLIKVFMNRERKTSN